MPGYELYEFAQDARRLVCRLTVPQGTRELFSMLLVRSAGVVYVRGCNCCKAM